MQKIIHSNPVLSLIVTAVLCGLAWRLELEYHGWIGLLWLSYFHYAIPIGYAIFLYWANAFLKLPTRRRLLINIFAAIYGVIVYFSLATALSYTFLTGPTAMMKVVEWADWQQQLFQYILIIVIPLIPLGAYLLLKSFKQKTKIVYLIGSVVGMFLAIPIAVEVLWLIDHKGGADYIHTIKSGVLVPLWVLAMGLLILGLHKETRP